jgi:MBG domain (YGX type)/Galactose oxidase, central domain
MVPNSPTSLFRSLSTRTIRISLLAGLIVIAAAVLSSTSFAGSLGQTLFRNAAAIIGGQTPAEAHTATANYALAAEAAAPSENSTMTVERRGHTATRLSDGRVLIAGGENGSGALNQTELYDPAGGTFAAAANMGAARVDHTATLLGDGRVLIAGGRNSGTALATTEIFDPATGVFTNGPSMDMARAGHSATLFANGRLFIAGGDAAGSAEILDLSAGTSTAAGSMSGARFMHSAALLQDGRVLVVGGRDANGNELGSGEIFDTPAATFWTIGNALKVTRVRAHLHVLFDGKVQIIGGSNDGSMEIYDPVYEGFGAYAHVLPESDTCVGLSGQILISQTRAALFHSGQADPLLDRSGHTITELNGQALVLGGVNGSGAVLSSSSVLASSSASVTTDKMDYAPGEIATIRGRGFQPGEVVRLKIHEDPHTPQERGFDATADAEGNFSGEYLVQDYDLDMKFIVGARGLTSGRTAQTTFTDSNPQSIAVVAPTSVTVLQGATANYGNQTLTVGGNNTPCTVTFGVTPALPAGATPVWGTNPVITIGANVVTTFSVTTTAATPAGTYNFQVTGSNGAGCQGPGAIPSNTLTLIVTAATVNTTTAVTNASATYGDTSVTLNATVTPASGPAVNNGSVTFTVKQGATTIGAATTDTTIVAGAASISYALPAGTDAGPYIIQASYTPGAGFNASSGNGTLTINKRAIEVTADSGQFKTYGDADPAAFTYSITSGSLVAPDAFTGALSRAAGENAGLYAITIGTLAINDGNGGNNYNLSFVSKNFEIKKRSATWTTNAASKTYGDADLAPLTTGSGTNFVAADNVTATYARVAGENASPPTYHITATLSATPLSVLNNYIITNNGAEFTINKRLATWTTNPGSKTYGDADPVPLTTGSGTNFIAADNITATYARVAGENASPPTYHITATLSATPLTALDNYIVTNDGAEFTINKRLATWTTNPGSKTYGDGDPAPLTTGSGTNFVAADNVTATYTRVAGENASPPTYHITATLSATPLAALDNYIITNEGAEFTINKRLATWTTNAASKTYGDADPAPLTTGSGTNFIAADNVTATYTRVAGENASPPTYHITATLSATPLTALDNYIITNDGAEFTINKRLASWTTNAASKTYGDGDPVPLTTGSGTNFIAADNVTATYARVAGENASPPTYHITATLSATPLTALDNYIITNDGAEFTINKRLATWTTNAASKTYGDGDPLPLTTGSGTNFVAADNVTATYARVSGENASPPTYHITATLSATPLTAMDNYIVTNDGAEFTINKRLATWTTNPGSKTYGDGDPAPLTTGSGTNFIAADNVTATYARVAGENASPPTYHITATLSATPLTALDNYIITNDGAEFTINKRLATWTTNPGSKTYGDGDPAPLTTGSGTNFIAADNVTATFARVAGENASPPTYHITATLSATPLSALDNYIITNDGAEFTINKRLATWTTNPGSKTYGDGDPVPLTTGNGTNFVAADNVTATYARVAGENASPPTYHVTATLSATPLSALDNYIITNDGAEFTINKRLATWTTNPGSKTYGDGDPAPLTTGSGTNFIAADNVTATYARVAGENASPPTYHITATLSATPLSALDNYIITNDGAEFTINKRLATWTTNPGSKTYGSTDPAPLTTGSGTNFIAADNVTATYARVSGENASPPTYHITTTLSATPLSALNNYTITNNGAEFTVNKRPIQVTATAGQFKIYGNPDPTFAYTITSGSLAFSDTFTGALSRVAGQNVGLYAITLGTLAINDGNGGNNYNLSLVSNSFEIRKRPISVKADAKTKTFGNPDPVFTYQITSSSLAFTDTFTGALTRDPGELVGSYAIKIGTLAINDGNGGANYTLTFTGDNLTIVTACSVFNGFLSPVGGAVELGNGGTFADPVRAFKLNSTIPVKFNAICLGTPLTTGIHTLQATKYSNATDSDPAIDATPTDAATAGNQFRLTGTEWHFNLSTKGLGTNAQGTWLLRATLFDGSSYSVWISIKK